MSRRAVSKGLREAIACLFLPLWTNPFAPVPRLRQPALRIDIILQSLAHARHSDDRHNDCVGNSWVRGLPLLSPVRSAAFALWQFRDFRGDYVGFGLAAFGLRIGFADDVHELAVEASVGCQDRSGR